MAKIFILELLLQTGFVQLCFSQIPFVRGADVSFLDQIETDGGVFKENGIATDCLKILKDHGFNYVRLRLWNDPTGGFDNLSRTLVMAKRISTPGFKLLLDFHYSDTWADPGHQTKPQAWQGISFSALEDSVYQFTRDVIDSLSHQGTPPAIVQLGNEITNGILWPDGSTSNWNNLGALLNDGVRGVHDGESAGDSIKIMIHLADTLSSGTEFGWFFDNLLAQNVSFDIIGVSYYPWWHGNLNQLETNLDYLANRYNKPILIAETGYPWTLQGTGNTGYLVGDSSQLMPGYPATEAGQDSFLVNLKRLVADLPGGSGMGICYWEPDWIYTSDLGSYGANLALFDFAGNALSSMSRFGSTPANVSKNIVPATFSLSQNYPNPFNPRTVIDYRIPTAGRVVLRVYNVLGQEVTTLVDEVKAPGSYETGFDGSMLESGIYFYRISAGSFNATKKLLLIK